MLIKLANSKLPDVETTIFTEMSLLAQQESAINLSQGFPDYDTDKELIKYLYEYSKKGFNQYSSLFGVIELRDAIAKNFKDDYDKGQASKFLQTKRDYMIDGLKNTPFKILDCKGTYFLSANFGLISDANDKDFCYWLAKEHKVAAIPFSAFYKHKIDDKVVRFCFAKKQETLDQSIDNLMKIKL